MINKRLMVLVLVSFLLTSLTPFLFPAYFEFQPKALSQTTTFGGPFPFVEQTLSLPKDSKQYPLEVAVTSAFRQEAKVLALPFLLSFAFIFLFFLSIVSILLRFFKGAHKSKGEY